MKTLMAKFGKTKIIVAIIVLVVVVIGVFVWLRKGSGQYQFVTVSQGSITQVVSVTGNTTPVQSLDLSFEAGGTIVAVDKNAGDNVNAGDVLVQLDTSGLQAQLAQAQAGVAAAQAQLAQLQAGPTPQSVSGFANRACLCATDAYQ